MKWSILSRKLHRWGAALVALPLLAILGSGALLHWKKPVDWIQPPEQEGSHRVPSVTFERILDACRGAPEAEIADWSDVDRVDVRPARGIVKVRSVNRWEVQLDAASGAVLQTAYRRSDLLEEIHDGSILGPIGKWAIALPTAVVLFGLWITGAHLWLLPTLAARGRRGRTRTRPDRA